ncbi:MAG: PadR family transcriptional regulator, partial [Candidatus Dormibacteria bacterium]
LLTWRADEWANVNPGSIYHALKTLTRDGFLRIAETGRQGARPERTAYELTRTASRRSSRCYATRCGRSPVTRCRCTRDWRS